MGLFKDFKEDFSQAVNEMMPGNETSAKDSKPEELVVNTLGEDVDVKKEYRGMGISKMLLEYILNKYSGYQFYLRVCPTDGVDETTLAKSVGKYGFITITDTENGTFMIKR